MTVYMGKYGCGGKVGDGDVVFCMVAYTIWHDRSGKMDDGCVG